MAFALLKDYGRKADGKSPYARTYYDAVTRQYRLETQHLPKVDHLGVPVFTEWSKVGTVYTAGNNVFSLSFDSSTRAVTLTVRNDQPDGRHAGDSVTFNPVITLNNVAQTPTGVTWYTTDPVNPNYSRNVIDIAYGTFCTRRYRVIEGRLLGSWIFPSNPGGDVKIVYNQSGQFRLKLGRFATDNDTEQASADVFNNPQNYGFRVPYYPLTISDTSTFYPDADPETTSVDGHTVYDGGATDDTIANIIAHAGNNAFPSATQMFCQLYEGGTNSGKFTTIYRPVFLWDTSSIPDAATITSETLSLYGYSKHDGLSISGTYNIYLSSPASNTNLVAADYNVANWGSTAYATSISQTNWSTTGYNDFIVNATGIANTSKTSVTKMGMRMDQDVNGSFTGVWVAGEYTDIRFYAAEQGAGFQPKLVVTYTLTTTTVYSPASNTGASWTNPTNAYADAGGAATITAGNPSGSNVWGTYGIALAPFTKITQVRIRHDSWSSGASGKTQNRLPTGNDANTGAYTASTGTLWGCMSDASDTTFITGVTNGGGHCTFTHTAFTVPANSTIVSVAIRYRHRSTTTNVLNLAAASIKIGGTYYGAGDTAGGDAGQAPPRSDAAIVSTTFTMTTNPKTGAAWLVADVNGSGSNPIQAFGVGSNDFNPDVNFYDCDMTANYTEIDDTIKIDCSWDGGTTWSSVQTTTLTGAEATTWYDVTASTSWNAGNLANGNLQVRALAQLVNSAEVINLDWLPVEVTYENSAMASFMHFYPHILAH